MTRSVKRLLVVLLTGVLGVAVWAAYRELAPAESMASLMPQGAVLFLEAKDFSGLLREWAASPEKQTWLKSDNYEVFSRSRLFGRLQQVQSEFAAAAGVPPDMDFLSDVAGGRSALGWYDIGNLELLYITQLPSARAMNSRIWQQRSRFEPRAVAGKQFFVRTDPQSHRVVAFAVDGDYFILGTREDLVAGALSLVEREHLATLDQEDWFTNAVKAAKEPGELRMVIHLAEVTKTPQFRTYWVQRNVTAMRQYESSLTDLFRSPDEYREERVLLPKSADDLPTLPAEDEQSVAELLRLAPPATGLYLATAAPTVEDALGTVEQKVLMPQKGAAPESKSAPTVALDEETVGSDSDMETRIDVPVSAKNAELTTDDMLRQTFTAANIQGQLVLQSSEAAGDGVFVRIRSLVILRAANGWNEEMVRDAIQKLLAPALTTAQLGAGWKNAAGYWEIDGLVPVVMAVRGKELMIGNDGVLLKDTLGQVNSTVSAKPVLYAAGFNHDRERQNFYRLTEVVDRPSKTKEASDTPEPQFFSQNVAGLSRVFAGVKRQTMTMRRDNAVERQTVRYEWTH